MVTPSGLPVLVECKLWRNPEARREVVSQILDYAKELSRWSSSDVQREVSHRLKRDGNPLLDMVRAVDPEVDERQFNDALTANLRRGRFLLLIVGDGIREGVEAIAEYLQLDAGLHFSLGLVELPIYVMPNGDRLVAPRVLARTALVTRNVVAVPDGYSVDEAEDPTSVAEIDPERTALGDQSQRFWTEFLDNYLELDDPEQPKPKPARLGYTFRPKIRIIAVTPKPSSMTKVSCYRWLSDGKEVRFARDSLVEGNGFELPVPRAMQGRPRAIIAGFGCKPPSLDYLRLPSVDITEGGPKRNPGTEALSRAEPEVRIHFPPAGSLVRT
jgi:hypothetical protein